MGSFSSKNWCVRYLLCVINVSTVYAWVKPLKDKNAKSVLNGFVGIINKSNCEPNKLWVDPGKEYYSSFMKKRLDNNYILMSKDLFSTQNQWRIFLLTNF